MMVLRMSDDTISKQKLKCILGLASIMRSDDCAVHTIEKSLSGAKTGCPFRRIKSSCAFVYRQKQWLLFINRSRDIG